MYQLSLLKFKSNQFLGTRLHNKNVAWSQYGESLATIQSICSGLIHNAGLKPCSGKENSFVGIYASTSSDSFMTEIACHWGGLVTIPIAAQAISSHILYVIRNTSLKVMVIDDTHLEYILQLVEGTTVKHIVVIGSEEDYAEKSKYFGISILNLSQLNKLGLQNPMERSAQIAFDTIACIYYNSNPKNNITLLDNDQMDHRPLGVVLTHMNMIEAISNYNAHLPVNHKLTSKDRTMHSFAIDNVLGYILQALTIYSGGSIVFEDKTLFNEFNLDVESVLSTVRELKPTIYASGAPFLKQAQKLIATKYGNSFIFQRGLNRKNRYHREGRLVSDCIYDMLVFREIRSSMFGGCIRVLFLDDDNSDENKVDLASFFRAVLGAQVIKTFTRPEASSGITATAIFDYTLDQRLVGPPLTSLEIKLVEYLEYTAEDVPNPRGEVKVRGGNIFVGYWNNADAYLDVVDADGWFSTNMIGELLPNGCFILLGSKKNL